MRTTILFLFSLFTTIAFSQNQYDFDFTIDSEAFGTERKIYVHVPEDYYLDSTTLFGVVYVLDAQATSFYNNAKSIIDYLFWGYQIMPTIVVGIHNNDRNSEFIPLNTKLKNDDPENYGRAHLLQQHFATEVFPLIEDRFRTNPLRTLIGHSRAGAFIANTIFGEQKDLFNAYIAISPSMGYMDNQVLFQAENKIKEKPIMNKFLFASHGTVGSPEINFIPQVNFLDSVISEYQNPTLVWKKKTFDETTHWSVVAPSIAYGMMEMNRAYTVDEYTLEEFMKNEELTLKEQINAKYKSQKTSLGHSFPLTEDKLRRYASMNYGRENYKRSIEFYQLALEISPDNFRNLQGLANAQLAYGLKDDALSNYEKTLQLLKENKMQLSEEQVQRRMEQINKIIASNQ